MIGIFDSGSGGLTVYKAIRDEMPSANIIYFGDIKNAPYGTKTREELLMLTVDAIRFLEERGAKKIVSACNSVSSSLSLSLVDTQFNSSGSLIEMVGPTVQYMKETKARILLCATPATIQSGIYQTAFRMVGKDIATLPLSELAGAIEFGKSDDEVKKSIKKSFSSISIEEYDILILGCTHYPLVRTLFREVLGERIGIFDPAVVVAEKAKKQWWPQEVGEGTTKFFISQDSEYFKRRIKSISEKDIYSIEVVP